MASILKLPTVLAKGVVIFTSREQQEFISNDKDNYKRIKALKEKWIIGLHHNWHDFEFRSDDLFDFHMAGEGDLISSDGKVFCHIPIECTHFTQHYFNFSNENKMWDILYVGRAINFKRIPEFFKVIRSLYDKGRMYRVLFICPIPNKQDKINYSSAVFSEIRGVYNQMFSVEERHLFNLLTLDFEYPFPFDIETLSHFYKSSRILVYTSDDERRPRTVAYAIASGMPTVLMASVASLLPVEKQLKPLVYIAQKYEQFPSLIAEALEFSRSEKYTLEVMSPGMDEFNAEKNIDRLRHKLICLFSVDLRSEEKCRSLHRNLDIRLARHYGFGDNRNSIPWSLKSFLNYLENRTHNEMLEDAVAFEDFEKEISYLTKYGMREVKVANEKYFQSSFIKFLSNLYHKYKILQIIYRKVKLYK